MDKRKIIKGMLILFAGMVIVFVTFTLRNKNNENDSKIVSVQTERQREDIIIDGIDNLYFIPLNEHDKFSKELLNYLQTNGIETRGAITQIGGIIPNGDGNIFTYYLYIPIKSSVKELFLKGEYKLQDKSYYYSVETNPETICGAKNTVCVGVDEQEAPEVENYDMSVSISNVDILKGVLTNEQTARLNKELQSFLERNNEIRREITVDKTSIINQEGIISFKCIFVSQRHDKKNINVEYESGKGFTFIMQ